jgi:3-isopropylmalate/(R)-2-methylmalate dehydratase small subunit
MNTTISGRVWVFGDSIDTDAMYPTSAMKLDIPEAAKHVFHQIHPGWTDLVERGDIVIAGKNFGVGSSPPAAALFRHLGVAAQLGFAVGAAAGQALHSPCGCAEGRRVS